MKSIWFEFFDLRTAFKHWLLNHRSHTFTNRCFNGHDSAHFDRCTSNFAIALCKVHVTDEQAATINEARQQQGCTFNHLFHVHVTAVFTWWNGTQALVFMAAFRAANFSRTSTGWLRRQCHTTSGCQLCFTCQPFIYFFSAWHHTNRTHETIHRNTNARNFSRYRFNTVQFPVSDERLSVQIWQETKTRNDGGVTIFIRSDVDQFDS